MFKVFSLLASVFLFAGNCFATNIVLDDFTGWFSNRFFDSQGSPANYDYRVDYNVSSSMMTLDLDVAAGTAALTGSFAAALKDSTDTIIGSAKGQLQMDFIGLDFYPSVGASDHDVVVFGSQGKASSSGTFSTELSIGNSIKNSTSFGVYGGFANPKESHPQFGYLSGNPFNLLIERVGSQLHFDIWVKSLKGETFALGKNIFQFHGDIHGRTGDPGTLPAEVPEPSTVLLLSAGVVGLLARKKYQRAA